VIEIARALEISHVPVDLLVTFDPYHQKPVPANVARAINYYQRGGWGLALVPEPGFRGKLINNDLAADATVTTPASDDPFGHYAEGERRHTRTRPHHSAQVEDRLLAEAEAVDGGDLVTLGGVGEGQDASTVLLFETSAVGRFCCKSHFEAVTNRDSSR